MLLVTDAAAAAAVASVMSDSVRPRRRQPTRLFHPWDSPGKNTGVGCHFLLQYSDDTTLIAENEEEPLDESERGE